ncbi:unnamed protein product [Closterium sp. NIES-53]
MVQFMIPKQQRGEKLAPKARWGLHLGVSPESKGWEVLDLTDNKVVTTVEAIFYETLSMELWKAEYGPSSKRTLEVPLPPPVVPSSAASDEGRLGALPAAPTGCIAGGRRDAEKVSDGKLQTTGELSTTKPNSEKLLAEAPPIEKSLAEVPPVGEPPAKKPILGGQSVEELLTGEQFDNDSSSDDVVELIGAVGGDEGELLTGEQSEDDDGVEVAVKKEKP